MSKYLAPSSCFSKKSIRIVGILAGLLFGLFSVQAEDLDPSVRLCVDEAMGHLLPLKGDPQRALVYAISRCSGSMSLAQEWAAENSQHYYSMYGLDSTPLHREIRLGERKQILKLLAQGIFTNMRENAAPEGAVSGRQGYTPLGLVIAGHFTFGQPGNFKDRNELVSVLLTAGADPNEVMALDVEGLKLDGAVPLYYAVRILEDRELARMLLDAGADPESPALRGKGTLLHWLAVAGDKERIHELACEGADVDVGYYGAGCGETPLSWAIKFRSGEGLIALIVAGADVNSPESVASSSSPVTHAVIESWTEGALALMLAGGNYKRCSGPEEARDSVWNLGGFVFEAGKIALSSCVWGVSGILPSWFQDEDFVTHVMKHGAFSSPD